MDDTTTSAVYAKLFPEQVANRCSSDAIEANNGPIAYLHALYQLALGLEATGDLKNKIPLATRRPDIGERVLDQSSLDTPVSALTLVIEAMMRQARMHAGGTKNPEEEIAGAQYPVQLPFHYPLEQIKAVLRRKKTSLFSLLHQIEYSFPSFTHGNLRTSGLRSVMRKAAGLSPALQSLLLDNSPTTAADFLNTRFGVKGTANEALAELTSIESLSRRMGLKPESILDLLATSGVPDDGGEAFTTVKQSKAYSPATTEPVSVAGHMFGAVFINNGAAPALSLEDIRGEAGIQLGIKNATVDRFGRMHKIILLQHALQLPYADVDLLVMAALRSEGQTDDFRFTENTLRALGVFQHMQNEYGITAEQFAGLIYGVTPYAVGANQPFLDSILDSPNASQAAEIDAGLEIDGREFELSVSATGDKAPASLVIASLCRVFALDEQQVNFYVAQITLALQLKKPTVSLALISALYRLARLPRLLRVSSGEGARLIALISSVNIDVFNQLAGKATIGGNENTPDILDVLMGVVDLEKWLRQQKISAATLLNWLTPLPDKIPDELKPLYKIDARIQRVVEDAIPRLQASLITEAQIIQAVGSNVQPQTSTWVGALATYIDSQGLIKDQRFISSQTSSKSLADELTEKLNTSGISVQTVDDTAEVADKLVQLLINGSIAQEDVVNHIIGAAFTSGSEDPALTPGHTLELLRWINKTGFDVLNDILAAQGDVSAKTVRNPDRLSYLLWCELERHAQVVRQLRLSPAGLKALNDHPSWFDLKANTQGGDKTKPDGMMLTLDLCYQISRYSDWVQQCERSGVQEQDALDYLANSSRTTLSETTAASTKRLGELIGWSQSETMFALSYARRSKKEPAKPKPTKPYEDFVASLTKSELAEYKRSDWRDWTSFGELVSEYMCDRRPYSGRDAQAIYDKFQTFVKENPGPLKVSKELLLPETRPQAWAEIVKYQEPTKQLSFVEYTPEPVNPEADAPLTTTLADIDFVLRLKGLCNLTRLSCQSLLDLHTLDESATIDAYRLSGQVLLGACNSAELELIESQLQGPMRDALAAYLVGHWAASTPELKRWITSVDELSSYFLTDVLVSSDVKVTTVNQATASLQHYLHNVFARLDLGYLSVKIPEDYSDAWRQYMADFTPWRARQTQLNHPANLIHYANRPNKSEAFKTLENELNQGKLDTSLLQTAITSYLAKFEQTSNLQVVSGYLDGIDPKNDKYHFIGKTNASPAEYYWRSVDMSLRDNDERLSPLAWSEWEKIAVTPSGEIAQSNYTPTGKSATAGNEATGATPVEEEVVCDAIRPVMIEGRPYVFWVERGAVELPDAADKNKLSKYKKISVQYIYKQSDGFWSPPNELLCLDGTGQGDHPTRGEKHTLKDDTYQPGLIAVVNVEGKRASDPWLTVILYNTVYKAADGTEGAAAFGRPEQDYFIESRDLLLVRRKELSPDQAKDLSNVLFKSYCDIRMIQHPYNGNSLSIVKKNSIQTRFRVGMRPFAKEAIASPHLITENDKAINYLAITKEEADKNLEINRTQNKLKLKNARYLYMPTRHDDFSLMDDLSNLKNGIPNKDPYSYVLDIRKVTDKDLTENLKALNAELASSIELCYYRENDKYGYNEYSERYYFATLESYGSITASANPDDGKKILNIEASYPKTVIKLDAGMKIKIDKFENDVRLGKRTYTVNGSLPDTDFTINKSITIPIEIRGEDPEALSIGYTVEVAGNTISAPEEQSFFKSGGSGHWTYNLVIEKSQFLFERSFKITVATRDTVIDSFPINATLTPDAYGEMQLILYIKGPDDDAFKVLNDTKIISNGKASFITEYPWVHPGQYLFILCEAGNPENNVGVNYDVRYLGKDEKWDISIRHNEEQAQYLDLSTAANEGISLHSNTVRLNTLFGKQLVSRAARSVDRAIGWDAQLIKEPTIDPKFPTPSVDFHGASGAYFRELFLHLPYLIATRLSEQQQFDEAEQWYTRYLFDPYGAEGDKRNPQPFWNTRPLAEVGSGRSEMQKAVDPTARAFILSRYYRQSVFLALVENWQRQGDHSYRKLTPSSLNHAWLSYQKALKLIGPLPERALVSRWAPQALGYISGSAFRIPINDRVINAKKTLEYRLFNLRHGLTIGGRLMPIMDWRTLGSNAFDATHRSITQLDTRYNSDRMPIPAYRFKQLILTARAAVQQLQDMGRHYMKLVEDESDTTVSVLLKQQEIKLSEFSVKLQQEAINAVKAQQDSLQFGRRIAEFREDYYTGLIDVGRSQMEEAASALMWSGSILQAQIAPFSIGEGVANLMPCIFGLAMGGQKYSGMISATIALFDHASTTCKLTSDQLLTESGYERRAAEWAFDKKMAEMDIQLIDFQLKESNIELRAANISLETALADRANLIEAHAVMTSGLATLPVYNWLVARQELFYAATYDAVLSLCLSAEAAWRYETGDHKSAAFIKTSCWSDSYKGMLAGESLLVDLLEMENAYQQRKERRLTIKKTIDLKGKQTDAEWVAIVSKLADSPLACELKSVDFDKNYPGHYLRQLKHVSVSFVMASGVSKDLENISAILTQTDSTMLVEPTDEGLDYLYKATKAPLSIKRNLRVQQQIALSSGATDDGLGFGKDDWIYELMFHDGRYLPFEGTGAISRWQLSFPDGELTRSFLSADKKTALVKNIQLHLVYTALDGGREFAEKVKSFLPT